MEKPMTDDKNHFLFIPSKRRVCEYPEILGEYPVVPEYDLGKGTCEFCAALIMKANDDAYREEVKAAQAISLRADQITTGQIYGHNITSGKISASQVSDHMDMPMWKVWAVCMTVSMFVWYLIMVVLWQVAQ
jgi:hypothetical protein